MYHQLAFAAGIFYLNPGANFVRQVLLEMAHVITRPPALTGFARTIHALHHVLGGPYRQPTFDNFRCSLALTSVFQRQ